MDTTLTTGTDEAAVEDALLRALYDDGCIAPPRTDHVRHILAAIRADPAAARAVRDAIDPDGLRAALRDVPWWPLGSDRTPQLDEWYAKHGGPLRLLEGTPDAD